VLGLSVTGTDTGVGKTTITCGILRCLRRRGVAVVVSKPVASGAESLHAGRLVAADTRRLAEAAGLGPEAWQVVTPWVFAEPLAPAVAARRAGVPLSLRELAGAARACARDGAVLLVEGAGGLLCPLTDEATVADLFVELGLPVVVAARRSLGTLNHTLLTVEAALRRGLTVAGVVVSEVTLPAGVAEATNVDELRRLLPVPVLAVAGHEPDAEAGGGLEDIDWLRLAGPLRPSP
jgi:dethiobiotin synthetase